jgi:hypothetical protein
MSQKYLSRYFYRNYFKVIRIVFSVFVFLCIVPQVFALQITEINFDPNGSDDGREWVEIFNDTQVQIKFTDYKFFEEGTNHTITSLVGDGNLQPGEYAVLVQDMNKFKIDFPNYSSKFFKASFSLSNAGENLALKDKGGTVIANVNYIQTDTGAKDGDTINYESGIFNRGNPSPGAANTNLQNNPTTNTNNNSNNNSTSTNATSSSQTTNSPTTEAASYSMPTYYYRSYWPESEKVYVYAGENKVGLAGAPVTFSAIGMTGDKKSIPDNDVYYFWSFGDGAESQGKNVNHIYKYPGEYVVNIETYANGNKGEDKIYVKVIEADLNIKLKKTKDEKVVEITNNTENEVSIANFQLVAEGGEFKKTATLSKKLLIMPKKSIFLSQELLQFATNTSYLSLNYPNGKTVAEYKLEEDKSLDKSLVKKELVKINGPIVIKKVSAPPAVVVYTKTEFDKLKVSTSTPATISNKFEIKQDKSFVENWLNFFGI